MSRMLSAEVSDDTDMAQEAFQRVCDLAASGHLMPRIHSLLRGCPFLSNSLFADAKHFAGQTVSRLAECDHRGDDFHGALAPLMAAPTAGDFLVAADAFERAVCRAEGDITAAADSVARCHFYATMSGHADSIHKVAAHAVTIAFSPSLPPATVRDQIRGTVAWLLAAMNGLPLPQTWNRDTAADFVSSADRPVGPGRRLIERMMESRSGLLLKSSTGREISMSAPMRSADLDDGPVAAAQTTGAPGAGGRDGVVIVTAVGNPLSQEGMRVATEFAGLIRTAIPLVPVPDLARVRQDLLDFFPYAEEVIDVTLEMIQASAHVTMPPLALVGEAGSGKTTFALRLARSLGLPYEIFPCGALNDGSLAGNSRRWATSEPSFPLSVIRTHRRANPAIILDDLDTAVASGANGSIFRNCPGSRALSIG